MTKSTITREQLTEELKRRISVTEKYPELETAQIDAIICKMALSTVNGDPVAWDYEWASCITCEGPQDFKRVIEREAPPEWAVAEGQARNVIPLYRHAQPAPVVLKDHQIRELVNQLRDIAIEYHGTQQLRERIARVLRAAMLQAEPVTKANKLGNSPVIPDRWIPVSERLPAVGHKVLAYRPDAPESNDPLIRVATYVGKSAHGHGFDCYCKPTHWMPLPAAPQESKS